jgi:hypothetical protein
MIIMREVKQTTAPDANAALIRRRQLEVTPPARETKR